MSYLRFMLIGGVLGQAWHWLTVSEGARWYNRMMQLEVQLKEVKERQEELMATGKPLAKVYPLK